MAGLQSLIRLRQHRLDEKRQAMAQLMTLLDNLRREEQRTRDDLAAEKKYAETHEESRTAFPNYNKKIHKRLKELVSEQGRLNQAIERAQIELQDAFKELKVFEITEHERERRKAATEKRAENQAMDEVGLEGFRRKKDK